MSDRRSFLKKLGKITTTGMALGWISPALASDIKNSVNESAAADSPGFWEAVAGDFHMGEKLVYLNNGTMGPMLQPVHESWKTGKPIEWTRVYDLPDFVYFDHSIHVAKGIGCTTCHGDIQNMPLTRKATTLHMAWCLECHRAPEKFIRPKDKVFEVEWPPAPNASEPFDQAEEGPKLVKEYNVNVEQLTNCSICHR